MNNSTIKITAWAATNSKEFRDAQELDRLITEYKTLTNATEKDVEALRDETHLFSISGYNSIDHLKKVLDDIKAGKRTK